MVGSWPGICYLCAQLFGSDRHEYALGLSAVVSGDAPGSGDIEGPKTVSEANERTVWFRKTGCAIL
jgi:hypothetical protein